MAREIYCIILCNSLWKVHILIIERAQEIGPGKVIVVSGMSSRDLKRVGSAYKIIFVDFIHRTSKATPPHNILGFDLTVFLNI